MVLESLLNVHPTILIVVVSVLISAIMVFVYKFMTDQDLMKRLKTEIKELQEEMKTLRDNPAKMAEVNKKAMETNLKYMMNSMKPTLITFIPIILIFGWLNGNIAYDPIMVGEEFSVELEFYEGTAGYIQTNAPDGMNTVNGDSYTIADNKVRIVFSPEVAGLHTIQYNLVNDAGEVLKTWENTVDVKAGSARGYEEPVTSINDEIVRTIKVNLDKFTPLGDLSIFGWRPGWIALYIVISIVCSLGLRKALNVY